jgi:trimeric autotransporter adhesin
VKTPTSFNKKSIALVSSIVFVALSVSVSVAFASLTFSGTSINGDSNSSVDATGNVTIGATSATGITIGRAGITATFPGTVTITGTTTTLQNLIVSGNCSGCGVGNFTAGGDLSGSSTLQTVIGLQGRAVSSTAPSTNQVLTWNGSFWTPANVSSTGGSGITAINSLSNSTTSIVGAGTVTVSTSTPNVITITGTGSGAITINSLTTSTFSIQAPFR